MKVTHITDIDKFFEVIDSCKGRVELVTGEGDRLNLKSKLSQYVSLANIFSAGEIPELEIVAAEKTEHECLFYKLDIMIAEKETRIFLCHHDHNRIQPGGIILPGQTTLKGVYTKW